jgi:hypothetical protein
MGRDKKWASNDKDKLLVENWKKFMEEGDFSPANEGLGDIASSVASGIGDIATGVKKTYRGETDNTAQKVFSKDLQAVQIILDAISYVELSAQGGHPSWEGAPAKKDYARRATVEIVPKLMEKVLEFHDQMLAEVGPFKGGMDLTPGTQTMWDLTDQLVRQYEKWWPIFSKDPEGFEYLEGMKRTFTPIKDELEKEVA